jgi:hypothetical protein
MNDECKCFHVSNMETVIKIQQYDSNISELLHVEFFITQTFTPPVIQHGSPR